MKQIKNESVEAENLYQYFLETAEISRDAADIYERKGWSRTAAFFLKRKKSYQKQADEIQKKYGLVKERCGSIDSGRK